MGEIFTATLNQMLFMFLLIFVGFILQKLKVVPEESAKVLSKLESVLLIPALALSTFMHEFTIEAFQTSYKILIAGLILALISLALGIVLSRILTKDEFKQKTYIYVLAFSNFSYVGVPVVQAVFPEYLLSYVLFTLPPLLIIFGWGVGALLIPKKENEHKKQTFTGHLLNFSKAFLNPMVVAVVIGAIIGITGLTTIMPKFVVDTVDALRQSMSPIAMLLTGMVVAKYNLTKAFKDAGLYIATSLRLLIIPILTGLLLKLLNLDTVYNVCILTYMAMPLGLNTVIIPTAYGKDTSFAAGLAIFSHVLAVITIPLVFMMFF